MLRQSAREGSLHGGKQSSDMERKEIVDHLDPTMSESLDWSFIGQIHLLHSALELGAGNMKNTNSFPLSDFELV